MIPQNALVMAMAGLASFAAANSPPKCPKKCIDGITKCGQRWGGCYNICTDKPPRPPPCPTTKPTPTPTPTDDCRTRTVCIDYINSCGMMYGT
ncbi:hypothetical protein OCS_01035 [Ophiocordyceps sinensis CO18]|nr:hypothetical protein OCS_01035 [Ophiocordyceps sinensis CO18]